jgi:hypothetical protein
VDEFIDSWHARVHSALSDGLAHLAKHEELPAPDGVIGDWVDVLCAMRFEAGDVPSVAKLVAKRNPYLQEIGVRLAISALRDVDAWPALESSFVTLIARGPIDAWVVEAIVDLLRRSHAPVAVFRELAKRHGQSPRGMDGIMRNRAIRPWSDLETVYEQLVIQALQPGEREAVVVPVLEAKLGTKGFSATQDRILRDMGFDPEEHRSRLRGV